MLERAFQTCKENVGVSKTPPIAKMDGATPQAASCSFSSYLQGNQPNRYSSHLTGGRPCGLLCG